MPRNPSQVLVEVERRRLVGGQPHGRAGRLAQLLPALGGDEGQRDSEGLPLAARHPPDEVVARVQVAQLVRTADLDRAPELLVQVEPVVGLEGESN